MTRLGSAISLILALFSTALLLSGEVEKVERARQEAEAAIENISGTHGIYTGTALEVEEAFANTLWGGSSVVKQFGHTAADRANLDAYYRVEGEGVLRGGLGMANIPPEKIAEATKPDVARHFQDMAASFIADKPYDDQSYSLVFGLFLLKLLLSLGSSMLPLLLSLLAKPFWFAGLAAAVMFVVIAALQPASGQVNLLKMNTSVQDGSRSVTPVLFRFWDSSYGFVSATASSATIGGGPSWSITDSLESARRKLELTVSHAVSLTHNGNRLTSYKLWNVLSGSFGRLRVYSKSFLSFPTGKLTPNLGLSANHLAYRVRDKLQLGWRSKNVLVKTPSEWINNWRMGPMAKYQLSDRVSGLLHYAPVGNTTAVRIELNFFF